MYVYLLHGYKVSQLMHNFDSIPRDAFQFVQTNDINFQRQLFNWINNINIDVGLFKWTIDATKEIKTALHGINNFTLDENGTIALVEVLKRKESLIDDNDQTTFYFCVKDI